MHNHGPLRNLSVEMVLLPPCLLLQPSLLLPPPHVFVAAMTACHAAAMPAVGGASSVVLVRSLVRSLWENALPDWVHGSDDDGGGKAGISGGNADESKQTAKDDEMANLAAVMHKLKGLLKTGHDRLGSEKRARRRQFVVKRFFHDRRVNATKLKGGDKDNIEGGGDDNDDDDDIVRRHSISQLEWHVALLVYWQLCNQMRARHPTWRDDIYQDLRPQKYDNCRRSAITSSSTTSDVRLDDGNYDAADNVAANANFVVVTPLKVDELKTMSVDDDVTPFQVDELQTMLRYATWAYEPDDENLRSFLLGGIGNCTLDEEKLRWMVPDCSNECSVSSGGLELLVHRTTDFVNDDDGDNNDDDTASAIDGGKNDRNNKNRKKRRRKPPGRVGYYVAVSNAKQMLLIGMKGTSTLEDLLTDCCGRAVRVDLDNDPHRRLPSSINDILLFPSSHVATKTQSSTLSQSFTDNEPSFTNEYMEDHGIEAETNRSNKLRGVHEGILHCARVLLTEISPLVEEYAVTQGYDIVCVGHSLGGGAAIVLAVLLRGKYPSLTLTSTTKERVRAYAFAPPPVLDRSTSLACRHYVTSVVNNSDIVPRSSLTSLDAFLTILESMSYRLSEMGMNPTTNNAAFASSIIALLHKLCEGTEGELILTPWELHRLWEEAMADSSLGDGEYDDYYWDKEFGHHLFVPGRLLLMYESWLMLDGVTNEGLTHTEVELPTKVAKPGQDLIINKDENNSSIKNPAFHAMWTDGTVLALRGFEIGAGSGMVTDHLTSSYKESLSKLRQLLWRKQE